MHALGNQFHKNGVETVSGLIELTEWSFWSHIGMAVLPEDIGLTGGEPYFREATSSGDGIVDLLTGKPKESGPMLVSLRERIQVDLNQHYDTHFKVKYLSRPLQRQEPGISVDIAIANADHAIYQGRIAGRNQCRLASRDL